MARPNYFTTMKNFALQQPLEDWMILEFSQLGFIGPYWSTPPQGQDSYLVTLATGVSISYYSDWC